MAGHPGGVGPEQIVAELGPVRGHDDEIDAVAFRKSQDLLVDGAAGDHVPHRNPVGDALAHEGTQVLLCRRHRLVLVVGRKERRHEALAEVRNDGHDVERSEEHTSELQSLMSFSDAAFCMKTKKHLTTTY